MEERRKKDIVELTNCSLEDYKSKPKRPLVLVADNVRSMYNVGAMMRTADALLVQSLVLGGITGCPPHPEITKTALGAEESVDWTHTGDTYAAVLSLKERGWKICVLEQTHNSIPLQDFRPRAGTPLVLVVGNEVHGVDQRIVDLADAVLEIPQEGVKHSLNVSVSAGIALWHLCLPYLS